MEQQDRDTLVEIKADTKWLKNMFERHLTEHFRVRLLVLGSLVAALSALVMAFI